MGCLHATHWVRSPGFEVRVDHAPHLVTSSLPSGDSAVKQRNAMQRNATQLISTQQMGELVVQLAAGEIAALALTQKAATVE